MPFVAKKSVVFLIISRTVNISVFVPDGDSRRREIVSRQSRELLLVVGLLQRGDNRLDVSLHHLRQAVEGESDAVIGQPVLREIIGANPFAAITGPDLTATRRRVFRALFFLAQL